MNENLLRRKGKVQGIIDFVGGYRNSAIVSGLINYRNCQWTERLSEFTNKTKFTESLMNPLSPLILQVIFPWPNFEVDCNHTTQGSSHSATRTRPILSIIWHTTHSPLPLGLCDPSARPSRRGPYLRSTDLASNNLSNVLKITRNRL